MLRVETHPEWLEASRSLGEQVRDGEKIAVRAAGGLERLVAGVLNANDDAVHVFVPRSADQTESVLLSLAMQLGREAVDLVDTHLEHGLPSPEPVLEALTDYLSNRPVIVDGWDRLGQHGTDPELARALKARSLSVRRWLAGRRGLFLSRRGAPPDGATQVDLPESPPVALVNGAITDTSALWDDVDHDPRRYALALACEALGVEVGDDLTDTSLRFAIRQALPSGAAQVLDRLGLHGRPLQRQIALSGLSEASLDDGCALGLWAVSGEEVLPDPGWTSFFRQSIEKEERVKLHLSLAQQFLARFREHDPTAARVPLLALAAYRHLVDGGDIDRARPFVRYGVALLIDSAYRESIARRYERAAVMYGIVVDAVDNGGLHLPQRLRAYARHYLHFNRGHASLEPLAATERGFRQSLEDWRGNALFWSRLVRTVCYQGRRADALADLAVAQQEVDEHAQKQTFLIARTVRGLLDHNRRLDAVAVWGDYKSDTVYARNIERSLIDALSEGWLVRVLDPVGSDPICFNRPVDVRAGPAGSRWSAELVGLDLFGRGKTPDQAVRDLTNKVRREASRLVLAYTSDLSAADRLRKRRLLGAVDVLASGVGGRRLDAYWVMGRLERDASGRLWLVSSGTGRARYSIEPNLDVTVDDLVHLARVATDGRGVPVGPVLAIEPGFTGAEDDLWAAWRSMVADAG